MEEYSPRITAWGDIFSEKGCPAPRLEKSSLNSATPIPRYDGR